LLATPAGLILSANAAGAEALGTSVALLRGVSIASFAVERDLALGSLRAVLRGGADPFALQSRDGRRCSCEVNLLDPQTLLLRLSGGPESEVRARKLYDALVRVQSVTGVEPEAQLDDSAPVSSERPGARLERLHAFTGALAQAISPAEVIEVVIDMGLTATAASAGAFWQISEDGDTVRLVRSVGMASPPPELFSRVPLAVAGQMPIIDAIRTGSPLWFETSLTLCDEYPGLGASPTNASDDALVCLPLLAQGRSIGGLSYRFDGPRRFTEDARSFLQLISWYAAQAFERARLYAAEKAAREAAVANQRRAEFLGHAGEILNSSLDCQLTLARLAREAIPSVADWCLVVLSEQSGLTMEPIAAHADPAKVASVLAMRRHFGTALAHGINTVIRTGTSLHHRELSEATLDATSTSEEFRRLWRDAGVASALVVPISAGERILGAILLVSANRARLYEKADVAMAEELARRAGMAIENARLYSEARDADRRKDEFLAMLGHELRNPLAPIRTALDLMGLHDGSPFEHERTIIKRQVEHVVELVDDLLEVSRITRGKIELRRENLELSSIVARAVEMASPALEQHSHELSLSVPRSGVPVLADLNRLAQAIANLLTNAAKFSEPRGLIELSAARDGDQALIRVRDSGIGISREVLPHIFDPFFQGARTGERSPGGLGLGLAIVKSLVNLHGGTVTAHSDGLGRGSVFTLKLQLAQGDHALNAQRPATVAPIEKPTAGRILVVDDNDDAASMLAALLEHLGHVVRFAYDGPSALAMVQDFAPEIALLDIELPVMDGHELARRLRGLDVTAKAYLVAVTGYGQEADRVRALAAGFDEHTTKPVGLDTLRAIIARGQERSRPA